MPTSSQGASTPDGHHHQQMTTGSPSSVAISATWHREPREHSLGNTTPHADDGCEAHPAGAEQLDRANDSGVTLPVWFMGTRASARWLLGGYDFP
jgi:hypothetical protein